MMLFPLSGQTPYLKTHSLFKGKREYKVNEVFQDQDGLIWFGTSLGLIRYDGINYRHYSTADGLADDRVNCIGQSADGRLWLGHQSGEITLFRDGTGQTFLPEEGLGSVPISDILFDSAQNCWFSTIGEGIYRYDGKHMVNFNTDDGLSDDYAYRLDEDDYGRIWVATDYGLSYYADSACHILTSRNGLPDNIVRSIRTIEGNHLLIGTEEGGVCLMDLDSFRFSCFDHWMFGEVTDVLLAGTQVWAATARKGIITFPVEQQANPVYRATGTREGMNSQSIFRLEEDVEKNIWIGTQNSVIQSLPPVFEFLNATNGLPFTMVYSFLTEAGGTYWACSEAGLFRGNNLADGSLTWENLSEKKGLKDNNFISIYQDKAGNIWAGTYGQGVFRIHPGTGVFTRYTTHNGLSDNNVISISGDDSLVWFSTLGGGVCSYGLRDGEWRSYGDETQRNSYVYQTASDGKGKIWLAGSFEKPVYIENGAVHSLELKTPSPAFYSVATDWSGNPWFNSLTDGIALIMGDSLRFIGREEGFEAGEVQSMVFENEGRLILFSNDGFYIYNLEDESRIAFGENAGLSWLEPILNSSFRDAQGNIWFGTGNGLVKYNSGLFSSLVSEPRIFISEKKLNYNTIEGGKARFGHKENNFTFSFTGLWYKDPESLQYRYMLEGYDPEWNYSERPVSGRAYSQLPSGDFVFIAETSIDGKNWISSERSVYRFRITPPFWQRWWFITSAVLFILAGIYGYTRYRLRALERDKEHLEGEVRKRTEEIRNKNEELQAQKEEIAAQRDLAEEQRDFIQQQQTEIQASIRYAQRIQNAALVPPEDIVKLEVEYFILNKPRDIVSGDFYWVAGNKDLLFVAVADCTGHGVPGAFMSMLGMSSLNEIVKGMTNCTAAEVLDKLRDKIKESLHHTREVGQSYDGMDIAFCIIDRKKMQVQFAGANNPLYIVENNELRSVEPDKMPIGPYRGEEKPFINHTTSYSPGSSLYLFSDGFADQFGGPKQKKYLYGRFREKILAISKEPMDVQRRLLEEEIEAWKGNLLQIDDILVMGLRL
jgi:ligand-binding sensor domain-containing protein/serine phosphatase RsbU (regulator of sigma subunit)